MSPSASSVKIWWDTSIGAYRLSTPFNPDLVTVLKTAIPASDRSYDPQTKIWTFTERHLDSTLNLFKTLLTSGTPSVVTRQQAEQAQSSTNKNVASQQATLDSVIVSFMKTLPYEAALSAYRKAAMMLHPDRGGSMEKMSQLNATWSRLEKELWKQ